MAAPLTSVDASALPGTHLHVASVETAPTWAATRASRRLPLTLRALSTSAGSAAGAPPSTKPRKLPGSLRVTGRDGSTAPFPWAGTSGAGATVSSDALRGTQQPAGVAAQPQPQPDGAVSDQPGVSGRQLRFQRVLNSPVVDLAALRELAWGGVPDQLRPAVWRLLTVRCCV